MWGFPSSPSVKEVRPARRPFRLGGWLITLLLSSEGLITVARPLTNQALNVLVDQCKQTGWDMTNVACLDMPDWDTSEVSDMSSLFAGDSSFNIDLSKWNTGSVTTMAGMFNGASSFNADISSWDTKKVTSMHWMFWGATSFNVDIHAWKTGAVQSMVGMFRDASSFNTNLESWDIQSVSLNGMDNMFDGCPKLSLSDVNECISEDSCEEHAVCSNSDGSYSCACSPGFVDWSDSEIGTSCDKDECSDGTHNCNENALCEDTEGSFSCSCLPGYVDWSIDGEGMSCDQDQCADGLHNCDINAFCTDEEESPGFSCSCKQGWTSANGGLTCEDVDECITEQHNCDTSHATCHNSAGGFACECAEGMETEDGGKTCFQAPEEYTIRFTATLEMTLAAFTERQRQNYMSAVASAAGVKVSKVAVGTPHEWTAEVTHRRLLSHQGILVPTTVNVEVARAQSVENSLAFDVEPALRREGIEMLAYVDANAAPPSAEDPTLDPKMTHDHVARGLLGGAVGVGVALILICVFRKSCGARAATSKVAIEPLDVEKGAAAGTNKKEVADSTTETDVEWSLPPPTNRALHGAMAANFPSVGTSTLQSTNGCDEDVRDLIVDVNSLDAQQPCRLLPLEPSAEANTS